DGTRTADRPLAERAPVAARRACAAARADRARIRPERAVLAALLPAARRRRNAGYGAAAVAAAGEPHGDRQAPRPEAQHAPAPAGRGGGSRNRLHGGPATPAQRSRATAHDDERRALVRTADRARAPPHDDHGAGDAAATAAHRAATAIMGRGARRARPEIGRAHV